MAADVSLRELHGEMINADQANIPGHVPRFYNSFQGTVAFLATIIFHCSAQHSAFNDGQVRVP